ncbi:MAG: iron ABC transporter permease [Deltaproteobacteria bacterium]|nr:iron ABC transporter permease [Deltaproteobacteria bacterium]
MIFAMSTGSESINMFDAITGHSEKAHAILFSARLPRVLLAALVGMALATSGGAFQALLRNPLADPFILGVSGGAALGSVLAVGFRLHFIWISLLAFVGATIAMLCIFWIAKGRGRFRSTELLLTGVIFNAFCFALILFINAMVTMEEAYQILFLLIGNLEETGLGMVGIVAFFVLTGFTILTLLARRMNLLLLSDNEAKSLGINIDKLRIIVFCSASLMVGAAVAASGLIGFVGLFIPHIVRLIFGADHRILIPASGLLGAAFLILADTGARTVLMNTQYATQLPVGVITALIGAPLFMILLKRRNIM